MSALPETTATSPVIGPVLRQERIEVIDVLRGIAILGILIVNMRLFSLPEDLPVSELWPNLLDRTVEKLVVFFAHEKFKTLFSFLFGLGLAVQMLRAEARGAPFLPLYLRRLFVLLLIGVAHFVLLWEGDILHDYAIDAFILLLFRRRALKTLLVWAAIFLCIPLLLFGFTTRYAISGHANPYVMNWLQYENLAETTETVHETPHSYSLGTYLETIAFRASDLPNDMLPDSEDAYILTMFLLGLYAGRRGIFHDLSAHVPFIRRAQRWGFIIGVAGNAVFAIEGSDPSPTSVIHNVGKTCLLFAAPAMTCFFASTIILLLQGEAWRRRLAPLAAVGRMALTNYLLQSLICTTIFYGYGLGLFGKVRPALGLLLTMIIFLIQIPLSVWWLRRFQFGPVEWVWRSLTYGQCQPMRVSRRQRVEAGG